MLTAPNRRRGHFALKIIFAFLPTHVLLNELIIVNSGVIHKNSIWPDLRQNIKKPLNYVI